MAQRIAAIVSAVVLGVVLITAVETLGVKLFPLPAGVDPMDEAQLSALMASGQMPLGAMWFVILGYAVGGVGAGWLAAWLSRKTDPKRNALVAGGILTLFGALNLLMIQHPLWMAIATLVVFLPAAYAGWLLAMRMPAAAEA